MDGGTLVLGILFVTFFNLICLRKQGPVASTARYALYTSIMSVLDDGPRGRAQHLPCGSSLVSL